MVLFKSFKVKLFLVLSALTVIPVIIVAAVSYNNYTYLINKQIKEVSTNSLVNSVGTVRSILDTISNDSITFAYQPAGLSNSVIEELKKYNKHITNLNNWDFFTSRENLKFFCETFIYSHKYINGIYIFTNGGNSISFGNSNDIKYDYDPSSDEWYKKTLEKKGALYISDIETKNFILNSKPSISFSRQLLDQSDGAPLGVLMLDCSLNIFNSLNNNIIPNTKNIYIVDKSGSIVYSRNMSITDTQLNNEQWSIISKDSEGSFKSSDGKILTVFKTISGYNWKVVTDISVVDYEKNFTVTRNTILYITLFCIAIFIVISKVLSNFITKPITYLSHSMRKNKSHQLVTAKKHLDREDEIGILYNEYNNLINEINAYIKDSYQNRLISMDSQMKALEAQINSHFLFNTLETINSLAEIEGVESISIVSQALGDMFRYAIKTESELVSVEKELEHADNYLKIQSIRYGNKLIYSYDISDNIRSEKVLKLILQPIAENAFYHAFENKEGQWELHIKGWIEANNIIFEVTDNGTGIPPDKLLELDELLNRPPNITDLGKRTKQSIGLKNIHSRIGLYYGQQYGLAIESKEGVGTKITVRVPRID